jgi:hypothetical protein
MENTQESNKKDWFIFAISLVAMIVLLIILPEWFWVVLPFVCTYFIKAINYM